MTDEERSFQVYAFANQRRIEEDHLQVARTASFLTASAFLFAGFVLLLTNDAAKPLSIFVCVLGIFLSFLQNRNTAATRKGRRIWEDVLHRASEGMNDKGKELLQDVERKFAARWGLFAPTPIQLYWLPVGTSILWILSLIMVLYSL